MFGPIGEAILLGVVQGITEFLPISSDGHLALAELLWKLGEGGLTFNVLLHAGTLIATLIVLRQPVGRAVASGLPEFVRPSLFTTSSAGLAVNATGLTISGTGFDTNPANDSITLDNGVTGTVTGATPTSLTVSIGGVSALTAATALPPGVSRWRPQATTLSKTPRAQARGVCKWQDLFLVDPPPRRPNPAGLIS